MPSQEDIDQQQKLLSIHRRSLKILLSQQVRLLDRTPSSTVFDIENRRGEIKRLKGILRGWGVTVEDDPDDDEATSPISKQVAAAPPTPSGDTYNVTISDVTNANINLNSVLSGVSQTISTLPVPTASQSQLQQLLASFGQAVQQAFGGDAPGADKFLQQAQAAVAELAKPAPDAGLVEFYLNRLLASAQSSPVLKTATEQFAAELRKALPAS